MSSDIVLVGCGNMGFAMLDGWLKTSSARFHVVEPFEPLRARAVDAGAAGYASADDLPGDIAPSLIFLAVKPQVMGDVAPAYAKFSAATFVSVAAGTTIEALLGWLGPVAIIRTMPNTPAAIGEGMLVSYATDAVSEATKAEVDTLLACCGQTGWIDSESLMDAVTAISGSGPAYVFHMIECLAGSAERLGLAPDLSRQLALQTVAGAGLLARQSADDPGTLRQNVTSPGGTTAAALDVLMGRLGPLLNEATEAARDRGVDLGKG